MVYVGLLVQSVADAVAAQFPNDPVTMVLRELLDGRSDVTEALPCSHLGDPGFQALPGDIQEFAGPQREVADRVRVASIADPTAQRGADAYTHDVPTMSPSRSLLGPGMPWTISSLTVVQMVPGKGGTDGEG
jgi:hypothetical protein